MPETIPPPPISPYLTVSNAAAALDFYKAAFGAEETARMPAEDGRRLMHAAMRVNGGLVMLSDEFPEHCGPAAPGPGATVPVAIAIALRTPAEVDAMHERAVKAGAHSVAAPDDMFWGDRFAVVRDPFGHRWMLDAPLAK